MDKLEKYKKALEQIASPISFMQAEAKREGKQLDGGIAIRLSNDASYLKRIAIEALKDD